MLSEAAKSGDKLFPSWKKERKKSVGLFGAVSRSLRSRAADSGDPRILYAISGEGQCLFIHGPCFLDLRCIVFACWYFGQKGSHKVNRICKCHKVVTCPRRGPVNTKRNISSDSMFHSTLTSYYVQEYCSISFEIYILTVCDVIHGKD